MGFGGNLLLFAAVEELFTVTIKTTAGSWRRWR